MATASQDNPLNLVDKSSYGELTDKQQAVVDAVIDLGRDASHPDVASAAGVTRQYAGAVRDVHGHIIDGLIGDAPGENDNGEETTEGVEDAIARLDEELDDDGGFQWIGDRPVKRVDAVGELTEEATDTPDEDTGTITVCVDLTGGEALWLLGDREPDMEHDVWERIDDEVVEQTRAQLLERAGL